MRYNPGFMSHGPDSSLVSDVVRNYGKTFTDKTRLKTSLSNDNAIVSALPLSGLQ
eukprot:SAG22_NODE_1686_length_3810_cov_13.829695_2_plen_55_part_00